MRSSSTAFTSLNAGGLQTALFYNLDVKRDATASVTLGALQDNGVVTNAPRANAEMTESRAAALASMRESVVRLAVTTAERVVSHPIDVAGQRSVIERYLESAEVN